VDTLAAGIDVRSYEQATFEDVALGGDVTILDVRRDDEVAHGRIEGSVHIPLHALVSRMEELPAGTLWVHCASGFRASIAASLIDRAGRRVVHIDDDYANAEKAGLPMVAS
jgi:rhodanese-related sulfurtransferase